MAGRNMAAKWATAGLPPAQASAAAEGIVRAATQAATRRAPGGVVLKKLGPDAPGAKRLAARYGEALVCVRYREDAATQRRYTTVELVVDLRPLPPPVMVRIDFEETKLRLRVKAAGGLPSFLHLASCQTLDSLRLKLTIPIATATPAVQSNEVYPPP